MTGLKEILNKYFMGILGLSVIMGCQKQQTVTLTESKSSSISKLGGIAASLMVSGPQILVIGTSGSFELLGRSGINPASATWDFGDGTQTQTGSPKVNHTFNNLGYFNLTVDAIDSLGNRNIVNYSVNVVDYFDGLDCMAATSVSVPSDVSVGQNVAMGTNVQSCFQPLVTQIVWDFGDGSAGATGSTANHTYSDSGDYRVKVYIYSILGDSGVPFLSLEATTRVADIATPTPTPPPVPSATPTPPPTPSPTPHPLACPAVGQTRFIYSNNLETRSEACGLNGTKTVSFHQKTTETCQDTQGALLWTVVSIAPETVSETACQGQSCTLPDGSVIADGEARVLYSTQTPTSACSDVALSRQCANGVLAGGTQFTQMTCTSGCGAFGIHGTVKVGVVTGEIQTELVCPFGEQGNFDVFNQISDQTCNAGTVVTNNTRQGELKSAGFCPVYTWASTDQWSQCTAACGGTQARIYECQDAAGVKVAAERCGEAIAPETRVCDAAPESVRRSEEIANSEETGATSVCPKNQIGVKVLKRDVTTVRTYACIDHAVQVEKEELKYSPWTTENYCRDFVAHRCSQDSLNNTQAVARYTWMKRCAETVPVIKDFLDEFEGVSKNGFTFGSGKRRLYATFMDHATKPEKPWIAPFEDGGNCDVPSSAYIAAVCVSSCATPDQEILAEAKANEKMKASPFIDALNGQYHKVATLQPKSSIDSVNLQKTEVQQWVTELIDTEHEIIEFHLRSGGVLKVTPNHPMVAADGSIRLAEEFKVGETLVKLGGKLDEIVSNQRTVYFGKVYNLFVESVVPQKNIVVTNGYLNGTAFFQNEGAKELNRGVLRKRLVRGVFN